MSTLDQLIRDTADSRLSSNTQNNYFGYITEIILYFVEKERQREQTGQDPILDYQTPLTPEFFTFYQTIQDQNLKNQNKIGIACVSLRMVARSFTGKSFFVQNRFI